MPAMPGYMSPMSPKMKKLFNADRQNLVLANPEMKFAGQFPLEPWQKSLVFGAGYPYLRNKYGMPSDIVPSTKQYQSQLRNSHFTPSKSKFNEQHGKWPNDPGKIYRWRRDCEFQKVAGKDQKCPWHFHLEPSAKKCEWPLCSRQKKNHWNYKLEDPIEKQLLEGAIQGKSDPLGFANELGDDRCVFLCVFLRVPMCFFGFANELRDDRESAAEAELDLGLRSHLREHTADPLGDMALVPWSLTNGIDWKAPDPEAEAEKKE
jgi:hypothetical protein